MTNTSNGTALESVPFGLGLMLTTLLSAIFMAQFDFFVVNVAAPVLQTDLQASHAVLELIVGGYAFAYAGAMITGGRMGDIYGYKKLFVIGMITFTIASFLCGVAQSSEQLVIARLLQGFTGALMVPQVLAIITASIAPEKRSWAIGCYGAASGVGGVAGQVLGGFLLNINVFDLGWRIIFYINVPVGIVMAVLAYFYLPDHVKPLKRSRLDIIGALSVAISLALILVPLSLGHAYGWPAWTWIMLVASVFSLYLTIRYQRHLTRLDKSPVLDLNLLESASFVMGVTTATLFSLYFASFMFTLTLLLQAGLGLNPFAAGLVFAPMAAIFSLVSFSNQHLIKRFGLNLVLFACGTTIFGMCLMFYFLHHHGANLPVFELTIAMLFCGLGNGIIFPNLMRMSMTQVKPERAGTASGMLATAQQFAAAAGVALIGAIYFAIIGSDTGAGAFVNAMQWTVLILIVCLIVVGFLMRRLIKIALHE